MAEIKLEITSMAICILFIFVTIFAGFNKYLFANAYFLVFYFVLATLLILIPIILVVVLYKYRSQRGKNEGEREELDILPLERAKQESTQSLLRLEQEKQEFFQIADKLLEQVDQKATRERQLKFEEREIELARQRFELEKERTSFALETVNKRVDSALQRAREMVDLLYPEISPEAKATIVNNLIPTLLHYSDFDRVRHKMPEEA